MAFGAARLTRGPHEAKAAATPVVYEPGAHSKTAWSGGVEPVTPVASDEEAAEPKLPSVKRDVPIFQARILDGCSAGDLEKVDHQIEAAISIGAPLYNDGDFAGCYATYEATAQSIERDVGKTCKGPAGALKDGRERAKKRASAAESAWAMRDAFDGLLDVIDRQGPEL